jgi:hypothetical protein
MVDLQKLERIVLVDGQGDYETYGQVYDEFLTDMTSGVGEIVENAIEEQNDRKIGFHDWCEVISQKVRQGIVNEGYQVIEIPFTNEYMIRDY